MNQLNEPVPRVFVLSVVVIGEHRGEHAALKVFHGQVEPRVARRAPRVEPTLVVQRDPPSVSQHRELADHAGHSKFALVFGVHVTQCTQADDSHSDIIGHAAGECPLPNSRSVPEPGSW